MGGYEYKLIKNRLAAVKTPGIEDLTTDAMSGDDGLTLVEYSPFGVIGSITPTTNPTETIICNSIGMLAAGNAVVFSPHPRGQEGVPAPDSAHQQGPLQGRRARQPGGHRVRPLD